MFWSWIANIIQIEVLIQEPQRKRKNVKKRGMCRKLKSKSLRKLTKRINVSLDGSLVFVRAQVSWKGVHVQGMSARMKWMLKWEKKLIW